MAERGGVSTDDAAISDTVTAHDRVLVLNPESGDGSHRERVRELAADAGYTVLETQQRGEGIAFARLAADAGADLVAAAGGDGTINEVARGIDAAGAFDEVTFGVVPAGTGNNLAENVGVGSVEEAFEALERGERRRIDVATADERLFLNSCIAGVTADASASTSPEMKERFGVLAYVICGLRAVTEFEGLPLAVEATGPEGEKTWSGEAVTVLVGNVRRFPAEGRSQANCEDGLLEVAIVERMPPANLLQEAAVHRLFGDETEHVTRLLASELAVDVQEDEPVEFSFDGEMASYESLTMDVRERAVELCVGDAYEPSPD